METKSLLAVCLLIAALRALSGNLNVILSGLSQKSPKLQNQEGDEKQRLMRYRQSYQHHPPEPRHDGERAPSEICGASPNFTDFFRMNFKSRSVNDEDKTIYDLMSKDKLRSLGSSGRYIELGAFDGMTESNTRFFDECLGWTGLLIEGNPAKYNDLTKNRPHAHRMSFAPSCNAIEEKQNKTVKFHGVVWTNAGLVGHTVYQEGHMVVDVPCGPLTPVIRDVLGGRVHFFSLDVEGSEPSIIENINFDEVQIDVLMVESWNRICHREPKECKSRARVRDLMKNAGYMLCKNLVHKSDLYIHPKSELRLSEIALSKCLS